MIKKLSAIFISIIIGISVILMSSLGAIAGGKEVVKYNNFELSLSDDGKSYEVVRYVGNESEIAIPSSFQNIKITSISQYALSGRHFKSITIPATISSIGVKALGYYYDEKKDDIVPDKGLKIYCYSGTSGEKYAKSNGFNYQLMVTKPADVTCIKVSATSTQAIKLICNKVTGATGYVFYRASAGKWVRVGVSKTNSFCDGNLKPGTSYRYAVKAYKTVNGKNYYSNSYPTIWTSTNPEIVNFTLTAASRKATVKWNKVTGATGYIVYYKTSANSKWQRLKTTTGISVTKTGLTRGRTYWFTVRAYRTVNGKNYFGAFTTKSIKVK